MDVLQIIAYQRQLIRYNLSNLITSDYVLLDLPYHSNIGDSLIWKGEEQFLSTLSFRCLYRSSYRTFEYKALHKDTIILMHGGGNLGDLYPQHNNFRLHILELYPQNRIVILPQTVYFQNLKEARYFSELFRKHKHLTICARDKYSYNFLRFFRFSDDIRMIPDMAFCINIDWLESMSKPLNGKSLYFNRVDKEASFVDSKIQQRTNNFCDVSDWPLYAQAEPMFNHLNRLITEKKYVEADEYALNTYMPNRIRMGVELISQYDKIYSNRLHGAILSILLGKEIEIIDNSYGKNSQYYKTWLKDNGSIVLLLDSSRLDIKRLVLLGWNFMINVYKMCRERVLSVL